MIVLEPRQTTTDVPDAEALIAGSACLTTN
jgi:hypothetical protein